MGRAADKDAMQAFLDAHPSHCEVRDDWLLEPVVPLLARLCLASVLPPTSGRSSILGIVTRGSRAVLFIDPPNASGTIAHVLFGGRPESSETPPETLQREVAEESGWDVSVGEIVGFRHFQHLGPPHPQMADRPYPDFVQPIYAAKAQNFDQARLLAGEHPSEFVDAEWALAETHPAQRPLLVAALKSND